ncbi:uncharacterized protein LOC100377236 [Saccoglossus kowalevskii]|uniref:Uncharacterized threonine-rich GPI-anchored glycoprotein PJ4664.02-like n=1 Tax=Saccoglossus kowalevskii TaxID=10224 RepID=A0ABM0GU39_SACKO|nr:PREDICTED: uncharacterized threonine-rich GPI-anchored glycoprotein PJ4664.02-like [Saccoglossus kowalevskii]
MGQDVSKHSMIGLLMKCPHRNIRIAPEDIPVKDIARLESHSIHSDAPPVSPFVTGMQGHILSTPNTGGKVVSMNSTNATQILNSKVTDITPIRGRVVSSSSTLTNVTRFTEGSDVSLNSTLTNFTPFSEGNDVSLNSTLTSIAPIRGRIVSASSTLTNVTPLSVGRNVTLNSTLTNVTRLTEGSNVSLNSTFTNVTPFTEGSDTSLNSTLTNITPIRGRIVSASSTLTNVTPFSVGKNITLNSTLTDVTPLDPASDDEKLLDRNCCKALNFDDTETGCALYNWCQSLADVGDSGHFSSDEEDEIRQNKLSDLAHIEKFLTSDGELELITSWSMWYSDSESDGDVSRCHGDAEPTRKDKI